MTGLRDLTARQWKSGIAAWLGWLFDGLDMHLYTVVATPLVAQLLVVHDPKDPAVGFYSSLIQAAFLMGWALGGGFFGRLGDRLGRARALTLTILTYASCTGLGFFAQTWWQLLIFRFLAALGIGGEWAVGAALLSETWPKQWRPWIAATLQTGVNLGVLSAMAAVWLLSLIPFSVRYQPYQHRAVFLIGVLPALLVLWIRRAVPEPDEWRIAQAQARDSHRVPRVRDLFRGAVLRTTLLTMGVCALSLTAHWAFLFWCLQHLNNLLEGFRTPDQITRTKTVAMTLVMVTSMGGNYLAGAVARRLGYPRTIALFCLAYYLAMTLTYSVHHTHQTLGLLFLGIGAVGVCQGVFALFTMYLPPLFPTLLRTTGAGFCYNIGRVVAAAGTVLFGLFSHVGDHRLALLYAGLLFLPAAALSLWLGDPPDEVPAALEDHGHLVPVDPAEASVVSQ
jgi:MFS family permease